ncbi:MAG: hypothetical protein CMO74_00525 [Verrucomicrobiales bacterium]|nr:hypothetical protein [Verrucomicrobiales bacterium]|tara:strand:+ start:21154 stop:21897 length:744 start_codon:yes stop_codon:yes gene_type:complete
MRSANPALNDSTFEQFDAVRTEDRMTLMGTVHKTGAMLLLLVLAASITWGMAMKGNAAAGTLAIVGAIGGLIIALITCFKMSWAPVTAPIYAALEGLFLGAISAVFEKMFPGIVLQAVGLTFGTLFALLAAYRSGYIKATENFKLGVVAATGGIFLVYLVTWLLSIFGVTSVAHYIHGSGTFGICFSLFVVVIAALNLVLDFDFIENGAAMGAPKYMEWYGAFGLMVTLIWLYIEILHLLAKLRGGD